MLATEINKVAASLQREVGVVFRKKNVRVTIVGILAAADLLASEMSQEQISLSGGQQAQRIIPEALLKEVARMPSSQTIEAPQEQGPWYTVGRSSQPGFPVERFAEILFACYLALPPGAA